MPRRSNRISLALVLLLSGNTWALGLGEIRLDSALNAPMRAQIELLSATPEELENLEVQLASQETFERYGLNRPYYLEELRFEVVKSGSSQGNFIRVSSSKPITEPFLTFLVEATWPRGRLLREYTVLLDPPTFAPPPVVETQPAVTAPQRSTPADSGRIERQAESRPAPVTEPPPARPRPMPAPAPEQQAVPEPAPEREMASEPSPSPAPQAGEPDLTYDTAAGDTHVVQPRETLWGIASRYRPDSRLTMNQTMLAIYEANPNAFGGNINILRAGARLRIPRADDIYRIDRAYALNEAKRQHAEWSGAPAAAPAAEEPVATTTRPSLQLVPPDEEPVGIGTGAELPEDVPTTEAEPVESLSEQQILDRIAELEAADVPEQRSLIELRDNELAELRQRLAEIRGELSEPGALEPEDGYDAVAADDGLAIEDELLAEPEDADVAETAQEEEADSPVEADPVIKMPSNVISSSTRPEPTLLDKIIGAVTNTWVLIIAGAVLLAGVVLFWFVRRDRAEDEEEWPSSESAADDFGEPTLASTEALPAPSRSSESIVVVEQGQAGSSLPDEDTIDVRRPDEGADGRTMELSPFASMDDTFSSETAVNLDQSDPIAEADFHMAYGLYDQAAGLVNAALESEPERLELLTKLCEIYFVWGNRDAFVDAARRVQQIAGDDEEGEWDKIVIMGQQIAADDALFAGADVAGATRAVDVSFDADSEDAGALDMDFGAAGDQGGEVIDLGGDSDDVFEFFDTDETSDAVVDLRGAEEDEDEADDGLDYEFDEEPGTEKSSADSGVVDFDFGAEEFGDGGTAEIDLDELGLDVDSLRGPGVESPDDLDGFREEEDDVTANRKILEQTGINKVLEDSTEAPGSHPAAAPDASGAREHPDVDDTVRDEALDIEQLLTETGQIRLAPDETGQNPLLQRVDETSDVDFDASLLDATGRTHTLSEDFGVETATRTYDEDDGIIEEAETLLASMEESGPGAGDGGEDDDTVRARTRDEETDFDFARTEALSPDVFTGDLDFDETGEMPAVASTDLDLDLDDLTAALKVSEMGDTVDIPRDDVTVEHIRPGFDDSDETSGDATMSLSHADSSDESQLARTMTEVGTKLDLARAYMDMGDPVGARSILEEVLDEGDESQRQQAQQLLESL